MRWHAQRRLRLIAVNWGRWTSRCHQPVVHKVFSVVGSKSIRRKVKLIVALIWKIERWPSGLRFTDAHVAHRRRGCVFKENPVCLRSKELRYWVSEQLSWELKAFMKLKKKLLLIAWGKCLKAPRWLLWTFIRQNLPVELLSVSAHPRRHLHFSGGVCRSSCWNIAALLLQFSALLTCHWFHTCLHDWRHSCCFLSFGDTQRHTWDN